MLIHCRASLPDTSCSTGNSLVLWDAKHSSSAELRWWLLGKVGNRVMLVRYTHRSIGIIRIIGAGYWKEGRDYYEAYWKKKSP